MQENVSPWSPGLIKVSVFRLQRISWHTASLCWSLRLAVVGLMSAERSLGKFDEVTGSCTSEAAVAVARLEQQWVGCGSSKQTWV